MTAAISVHSSFTIWTIFGTKTSEVKMEEEEEMLLQPLKGSRGDKSALCSAVSTCPSSDKSQLLLSSHSLSCLCLLSGVPSSPLCHPVSCIPPPLTPLLLKARTRLIDRLTWGKVALLFLLSLDQTCLSSPSSDSHFPFLPFQAP